MIRECRSCGAKNRVPIARLDETPRCGRCKGSLGPVRAPIPIESEQDFEALVASSSRPVLVDFWAAWCGPCRALAPELEALAARRAGELVVAKLDTEAVPSVAARFAIRSIPTLVLFRRGAEAARLSGAMPAAEIERRLGLSPSRAAP
ncbi:MAG: thioredoxin TrxC [Sandaracinaceae bacterium]|nr:thioredoxin TrxC [Sandaracinaceae bacterium]